MNNHKSSKFSNIKKSILLGFSASLLLVLTITTVKMFLDKPRCEKMNEYHKKMDELAYEQELLRILVETKGNIDKTLDRSLKIDREKFNSVKNCDYNFFNSFKGFISISDFFAMSIIFFMFFLLTEEVYALNKNKRKVL